jgi:hypothetical protein
LRSARHTGASLHAVVLLAAAGVGTAKHRSGQPDAKQDAERSRHPAVLSQQWKLDAQRRALSRP